MSIPSDFSSTRRQLLQGGVALAASGYLPTALAQTSSPSVRIVAASGYLTDNTRTQAGITRLQKAGFTVTNTEALFRKHLRFSGTDAQRAEDLQEVATGKVAPPQLLLGARGGYGAARLLPLVDWQRLGARLRASGSWLMGYSDFCTLQLALLAQGHMGSFAGPFLYSEFGSPWPSAFGMQSFIDTATGSKTGVSVTSHTSPQLDVSGTWWGGNLSVLASLAGSPYMPQIDGGILFLEDVGEQPYRIERMLQTLHLAGILKRQRAIVIGSFRISRVRDMYDENYDFAAVLSHLRNVTGVPVLTDFPFGHIREKVTMPLGFPARLRSTNNGYTVEFLEYPKLNTAGLNLATLMEGTVGAGSGSDSEAG